MSDILDDYRARASWLPERVRTHYLGCHMHHDECMIALMAEEITRLRAEVERLRLTDAEREAVEFAVAHGETVNASWRYTLRVLLARLGGGA